jgi:hypothetical protein
MRHKEKLGLKHITEVMVLMSDDGRDDPDWYDPDLIFFVGDVAAANSKAGLVGPETHKKLDVHVFERNITVSSRL